MAWLEKRGQNWFVVYRNASKKTKRIPAGREERAAGRKLSEISAKLDGGHYITDPFKKFRKMLLKAEEGSPNHLDAWITSLEQEGATPGYVRQCRYRLSRLIDECDWLILGDISIDGFEDWRKNAMTDSSHNAKDQANRQRAPMGPKTKNHFLDVLRNFCNWCVQRDRIEKSPAGKIGRVDETQDVRRERRAATEEEVAYFLSVLTPHDLDVYSTILITGLRRNEAKTLIWDDFHLVGPTPLIKLRAKKTKSKRADSLPLRQDAADGFLQRRGDADPSDRVFRCIPSMVKHRKYLALGRQKWINEAIADPREHRRREHSDFLVYIDRQGRRLDLHAFRVTYCSMLSKAGVSPRMAMELMRHTDIRLTMKNYTDPRIFDLASAVEKLPNLGVANGGKCGLSGTDRHQMATGDESTKSPDSLGNTAINSTFSRGGVCDVKERAKGVEPSRIKQVTSENQKSPSMKGSNMLPTGIIQDDPILKSLSRLSDKQRKQIVRFINSMPTDSE